MSKGAGSSGVGGGVGSSNSMTMDKDLADAIKSWEKKHKKDFYTGESLVPTKPTGSKGPLATKPTDSKGPLASKPSPRKPTGGSISIAGVGQVVGGLAALGLGGAIVEEELKKKE